MTASLRQFEFVEGHDFLQDPAKAVQLALCDVATKGVGHISNAFEPNKWYEEYAKTQIVPKNKDRRYELGAATGDFAQRILPYFMQCIEAPVEIATSAYHLYRTGFDGWHLDGTAQEPGLRIMGQIDGPEGFLAALKTNKDTVKRSSGHLDPVTKAPKYAVPYHSGSLVILPEQYRNPIRVATIDGSDISIEHPLHTGLQYDRDDNYRELYCIDLQAQRMVLTGLPIAKQQVRKPCFLG